MGLGKVNNALFYDIRYLLTEIEFRQFNDLSQFADLIPTLKESSRMWMVELKGNKLDLDTLSQSFNDDKLKIIQNDDNYFLTCDKFLIKNDANGVREEAKSIVALLNGNCRVCMKDMGTISVGGISQRNKDGSNTIYITPEPIICRLRATATPTITHPDGTQETYKPADKIKERMLRVIENDDNNDFNKVLRLIGGKQLNWVTICNILEIIEHNVGGRDAIVSKGWVDKSSLDKIKATANNPELSGDESRHGVQKGTAPSNKISLNEAQSIIKIIINKWQD